MKLKNIKKEIIRFHALSKTQFRILMIESIDYLPRIRLPALNWS
jgi:hypothetical protein